MDLHLSMQIHFFIGAYYEPIRYRNRLQGNTVQRRDFLDFSGARKRRDRRISLAKLYQVLKKHH